MIFSGEVKHHSALSWFVRIEYGMMRIVPCSPGSTVVNLLFRQLLQLFDPPSSTTGQIRTSHRCVWF
jgi:hypothetical protein